MQYIAYLIALRLYQFEVKPNRYIVHHDILMHYNLADNQIFGLVVYKIKKKNSHLFPLKAM